MVDIEPVKEVILKYVGYVAILGVVIIIGKTAQEKETVLRRFL